MFASILTRTFLSSTHTMTRRAISADRTRSTTCNWYTGGAIMDTICGSGTGRRRLEPDDGQPSCPVLRGLRLASALSLGWRPSLSQAAAYRVLRGVSHCEA